jgi:(p)ppGpp synthase/HD superfamily hydrolase
MSDALELWPKDIEERAKRFAHAKHNAIGHKRKYTGEPYTNHLDEVARIVKENGGTSYMVAAAFLHDVKEDVHVTNEELLTHFPIEIVSLVIELTDEFTKEKYPQFNRAKRKELENLRLSKITPNARKIKLADMEDNTKTITELDPGFAKVYLEEKNKLLALWGIK